jgi:hypothetical protein
MPHFLLRVLSLANSFLAVKRPNKQICVLLLLLLLFSLVVKALGYKPEGRRFEYRWGEILNLPNPSGRTRPWGLLNL